MALIEIIVIGIDQLASVFVRANNFITKRSDPEKLHVTAQQSA
ncbi:hypothetical protein [Rhizobium sp. SG_E_25_P2]|nr:hypothetical protein [Rhizobium sp. SG_E_25_P2]